MSLPEWTAYAFLGVALLVLLGAVSLGAFDGCAVTCPYGYEPVMMYGGSTCIPR